MKTVTFENFVDVDFMAEEYGINSDDLSGSGVYKVHVGSRGEVEGVEKVSNSNSFQLRGVEDIIDDLAQGMEDCREEFEMLADDGFIYSGKEERDECEMYSEGLNEEEGYNFLWVKV